MNRGFWCAALLIAFWACSGSDANPSAPPTGASGDAGIGGQASLPGAGAGAEPLGGATEALGGASQSLAGASESLGGAAAGTESASAGQATAGEAGAAPVALCNPQDCENGGACPAGGGATCECPDAFTGEHCELPRFELLTLPNGVTIGNATGLSADGVVVVGIANTGAAQQGFRWTHAGGLQLLGALPTQTGGAASAVSADGKVAIGRSGAQAEAVYWPAGKSTPQSLLSAAWTALQATHVSVDGSVIAGVGTLPGGKSAPFRWTKAGGAVALGSLTAQTISIAGMSADGTVIVGNSDDAATNAFIWSASDALQVTPLGLLAGDDQTKVLALSADGSTAVGDSIKGPKARRVRWVSGGKPVALDALDDGTPWGCGGGPFTTCTTMSRDGSVIYTQRASHAQRWTAANGLEPLPLVANKGSCMPIAPSLPRLAGIPGNCIGPPVAVFWGEQDKGSRLDAVLATYGIAATELTSATITVVRAVSANGDTIVGDNFNTPTVWIARVLP